MPAPATVSDFLDVCRKSGVVDESRLSTISGPNANSPMAAAKALIRAGALTKFQAGQLLAGKYRGLRFDRLKILDKIGAGGMGTVFLCEHLGLRKQVAVKVLPPDQAGDEGVRERFFREARAAASLDHPNIVRVHDMNSSGGVHYIVMEYVEGQDLQSLLNKYGPLPYGRACNYIAQAALGLQHAHEKGLVHRDIKPANLLVDKEGVVKILDLGLATFTSEKEDEKDNLTARFDKGAVLGTADYMAPEQILASSDVDIRADIYSLGVTLYALINGKPPFGGSCTQKLMGHTTVIAASLTAIRREVPKGLSAIVDKMIAKDPAQRFQTPAEVVEAMNPWLDADTVPLDAQQTRKMPGTAKSLRGLRPGRRKSKAPMIVGAVALSALVFGGLGVWALSGGDGSDKASGTEVAAASARQPGTPAKQPAAKSNPAKSNPTPPPPITPVAAREEARLIYEIDFSKVPAFLAKYEAKKRIALDGAFPPGWTGQSYRMEAVADVGTVDHNGSRGVAMRTRSGDGGSAEIHTVLTASPYKFIAGRRYVLRTDYANVGTQNGSFEVRFDGERPPVKNAVQLKPTRGEWQTIDLKFTAPKYEKVTTYFTHSRGVFPDFLLVRSVQVYEIGEEVAAPPASGRVVYEDDFSRSPAFRGTMAKPGGLKLDEGRLPDGWNAYVWKQGASGEVGLEEFAGKKGVALRTTDGDASAEFATTSGGAGRATVRAGHRYRVDVEYAAPGQTGGRIDVRLDDLAKPGANQTRLNPSGLGWQTAAVEFAVPANKDRPFALFVSNLGAGPKNTLLIRAVKLYELSDEPNAAGPTAPAGTSLYRLAAADMTPFKLPLTDGRHASSNDQPGLPAGIIVGIWRKEDTGEVTVEDVAGRRAITLTNGDGGVSVQVFPGEAVARVRAGQEYTLKVVHWGAPSSGGRVQLRKPETTDSFITHALGGTNGQWVETSAKFTATEDGPIFLYIQNGSGGADAKVAVQSVELFASAPLASSAAPGIGYKLDLSKAQAFAHRIRQEGVLESQGDGALPTPWAARTQGETVADVFVDPVGGQPALGLRNHEGTPSVELYNKTALLAARAGKRYAVRLTYQTEANGKGGFQAAVNGREAGRTDFAPSVGAWKDAELTVTAPGDGPLTLTITCGSVGSEASIFVKTIEIREV